MQTFLIGVRILSLQKGFGQLQQSAGGYLDFLDPERERDRELEDDLDLELEPV